MASPLHIEFSLANGENQIFPMNKRWSLGTTSIQMDVGGTSLLIETTLTQVNRRDRITGQPPTPNWVTAVDQQGNPLSAVTPGIVYLPNSPVEAFRITATGDCTGRIASDGDVS